MYKFDLGLVVEHTTGSNYKVFCNHCGTGIGTMRFQQIKKAIFSTIGRGGVRCVACRKSTCDVCGTHCFNREVLTKQAVNGKKIRACPSCSISIERLAEEVDRALLGHRAGLYFVDLKADEDPDENATSQMIDGQRCTCGGSYEHVEMVKIDDSAHKDVYVCESCGTECVRRWNTTTQEETLVSYS